MTEVLCCRSCLAAGTVRSLDAMEVPLEGGVEWVCPDHGVLGVRLNGGTLDVGLRTDDATPEPKEGT